MPITTDARETLRGLIPSAEAAGIEPNIAYVQEIALLKKEWEAQMKEDVYR